MMGQVKRWLEDLSVEMGYSGEITDEVMEEGLKRWPSTADFSTRDTKPVRPAAMLYDHEFAVRCTITNNSASSRDITNEEIIEAIGKELHRTFVFTHDEDGNQYDLDGVILGEGE
jgi:hypothetical protein